MAKIDMGETNHLSYFTSESVTEGHPDKLCDQISDAVLDAILSQDPYARVACEAATTMGLVFIFGEITCNCYVEIPDVARGAINKAGYTHPEYGFDGDNCGVITSIKEQSPDIACGVDQSWESRLKAKMNDVDSLGAGDQGIVFGFACDETSELMPLPISLAHRLARRLAEVRKKSILPWLRPDGKSQVTVEYIDGVPHRIKSIVLGAQHNPDVDSQELRESLIEEVIHGVIPSPLLSATSYYINSTGCFVRGGPVADSGLTGRKLLVDTYGGMARHGGGSFSGKDPTKVDRSASYAARYAAKNIVAAGLARRVELQIAYAIGVARPLDISINTFGTGKVPDEVILKLMQNYFDFRPGAIIEQLNLRRPIYQDVACYGHFGREDLDLPWEKTDKAGMLREETGIR